MTKRKVMEKFIEIYKSQPCLWQVQSKEYNNRKMKHVAYKRLVEILKLIDPQADREKVVKKINSLRSNYRKELKKVIASKKSDIALEDGYVSNLWYFDRLQFLRDYEKVRKALNNISDSEGEGQEEEILTVKIDPYVEYRTVASPADSKSTTSSRPTTPPPPRKKYKNDLANEAQTFLNEHVKRPLEKDQEDRFDIFGKNVAVKLRDIDDKTQRILAEKLINDVLFEAEMGTLTPQHYLSNTRFTA